MGHRPRGALLHMFPAVTRSCHRQLLLGDHQIMTQMSPAPWAHAVPEAVSRSVTRPCLTEQPARVLQQPLALRGRRARRGRGSSPPGQRGRPASAPQRPLPLRLDRGDRRWGQQGPATPAQAPPPEDALLHPLLSRTPGSTRGRPAGPGQGLHWHGHHGRPSPHSACPPRPWGPWAGWPWDMGWGPTYEPHSPLPCCLGEGLGPGLPRAGGQPSGASLVQGLTCLGHSPRSARQPRSSLAGVAGLALDTGPGRGGLEPSGRGGCGRGRLRGSAGSTPCPRDPTSAYLRRRSLGERQVLPEATAGARTQGAALPPAQPPRLRPSGSPRTPALSSPWVIGAASGGLCPSWAVGSCHRPQGPQAPLSRSPLLGTPLLGPGDSPAASPVPAGLSLPTCRTGPSQSQSPGSVSPRRPPTGKRGCRRCGSASLAVAVGTGLVFGVNTPHPQQLFPPVPRLRAGSATARPRRHGVLAAPVQGGAPSQAPSPFQNLPPGQTACLPSSADSVTPSPSPEQIAQGTPATRAQQQAVTAGPGWPGRGRRTGLPRPDSPESVHHPEGEARADLGADRGLQRRHTRLIHAPRGSGQEETGPRAQRWPGHAQRPAQAALWS